MPLEVGQDGFLKGAEQTSVAHMYSEASSKELFLESLKVLFVLKMGRKIKRRKSSDLLSSREYFRL